MKEQPCNGDVVRAMNNDQLAKFFNTVEFPWYFECPVKHWLDEPAKKEEWGRFWPW